MQYELASSVDARIAEHPCCTPHDTGHEAWLPAVLKQDAASDGADLGVLVTRGCGIVEVRVSGPRATLTLFFDHADLQPAHVRSVVRAAFARYRSSLLGDQPRDREGE